MTFFEFGSKLVLANFHASPIDLKIEYIDLIKGNYSNFDFPIIFKQTNGKKLTDILDTGFPGLFLISERLVSILEYHDFTGWKTYPIIVLDKQENNVLGYKGLSVTGRSGPIIYKDSNLFEKRKVPDGPLCKFYKGEFVELWDGSDFFLPENSIGTVVSKKVADVLNINKVTNLQLINLADAEVSLNSL